MPSPQRVSRTVAMLLAMSLLCVVPAKSSSAAPGWALRYWSGANGLPEEAIYGIQETSDGHLWLATRDGAIRFDGLNFFNTRPAVAPGPRDNSYGALLAFGDSLWLGGRDFLAYSGTDLFHSHLNPSFRFQPFPRQAGDRFGIIGLQKGLDGNIWVVRADGVFQQNPATDFSSRFTPVRRFAPPPGETILAFHQGRSGRLWISTESGVYEILPSGWVRLPALLPGATHLLEGRDGTFWSFGQKLLQRWSSKGLQSFPMEGMVALEPLRGLFEDSAGRIWAGLKGAIAVIESDKLEVIKLTEGLRPDDMVQTIFQDHDGVMWAASKWGCLIRLSRPILGVVDRNSGLLDSAVSAVAEDDSGGMWLSSRSKGIYNQMASGAWQQVGDKGNRITYAMAWVGEGNLLVLDSEGLNRIQHGKQSLLLASNETKPGRYRALSPRYKDSIYFGESKNLYRIRLPLERVPRLERIGPLSLPRAILELSDAVWAISWDEGLVRFENGKARVFPLDQRQEIRGLALYELNANWLLIGTTEGLMAFDRRRLQFVRFSSLFADEQVFAIQPDALGNLWLACRKSLLAAKSKQIEDYFEGHLREIFPLRLSPQQGLPSANFGLGTSSVSLRRKSGELWFSSVGGAIHFFPDDVTRSKETIRCAVSAVIADGLPKAVVDEMKLAAGTRNLEFRYAALGGKAGEHPVFRYRLAGNFDTWIESSSNLAVFSNLKPGPYRFEIQARSRSLEWDGPVATLPIQIQAYWYEQRSVQLGLGMLLFGSTLFGLSIWRNKRMHQQLELEARVRERTAELALARDEAERLRVTAVAAANAKAEFLATMSHEIRTPMNGVIGMVELLQQTPLDAEQQRLLGVLNNCGESLLNIVNDILDLSKIEAGGLALDITPFSLQQLLEHVQSVFSGHLESKGVGFHLLVGEGLNGWFAGDSNRLRQILMNLMSNAVKFTSHGEVKVEVMAGEGNDVEFVVSDSGIGIPSSKLKMIFEPFTQAESSTTRRFGGTGLGLAISVRLAEAMQGSLDVESTEGVGSLFRLRIPLPRVARPGQVVESPDLAIAAAKVLVVEDNAVNRHLACSLLKKLGCEVATANDGAEALQIVEKSSFDLILMDCHMPVMDGFEATRRIRQMNSELSQIAIVALSAGVLDEDVKRCQQAGMNQFLAKPVRTADLKNLLVNLTRYKTEGQPFGWPSAQ